MSDLKQKYADMARKNGRLARVKSGRVAVLLKFYKQRPRDKWLRRKALLLSKAVAFHLRQASILGKHIDKLERASN